MNETVTGTRTLAQSGLGSKGNEAGTPHSPRTGASLSDAV